MKYPAQKRQKPATLMPGAVSDGRLVLKLLDTAVKNSGYAESTALKFIGYHAHCRKSIIGGHMSPFTMACLHDALKAFVRSGKRRINRNLREKSNATR